MTSALSERSPSAVTDRVRVGMNFPEHQIRGPRSFVSESAIEEQKKKRQEEWERTRKPDDPLEAPEEVYDPRSLYERLQEQKMKKEADFEEKNKLQNLIPKLDDEEVQYLQAVDKMKEDEKNLQLAEEKKALLEYQVAISSLSGEEQDKNIAEFRSLLNKKRLEAMTKPIKSIKGSQAALLSGIVKKSVKKNGSKEDKESQGSSSEPNPGQNESGKGEKRKRSEKEQVEHEEGSSKSQKKDEHGKGKPSPPPSPSSPKSPTDKRKGAIKCIGVLPGIGCYGSDSSDSERSSSDSDVESKKKEDVGFSLIPRVTTSHTHNTQEAQKQ